MPKKNNENLIWSRVFRYEIQTSLLGFSKQFLTDFGLWFTNFFFFFRKEMTKIKIWMASKNINKLLRKLKQKFRKIFITLRGASKKYVSLKFPGRILNTIQEVKSPATFLIILLHKCHCVVNILMSNLHFCVISSWRTTRSPWSRFLALNALFCCQPRLEISGLTKRVIWCKKNWPWQLFF